MTENYEKLLDGILLSDNPYERFTAEYYGDSEFKTQIDKLLPEAELCFKQTQNTPWHIYGVMEHILRSVGEMNKLSAGKEYGARRILAYAMFFHDLGKPEYHRIKEVDGQRLDSFTFHNIASERIAARALKKLSFCEEDRRKIIKLVADHDIFLKISDEPKEDWQVKLTPEFLREYIEELDGYGNGKELFGYLLMVGVADNRAQNPAMTGGALGFIKKIKEMSDNI